MRPTHPVVIVKRRRTFPRRGLGQDDGGFDVSTFSEQILPSLPGILGGVAQVVKAENTPGLPYSAAGYPMYTTASGQTALPGLTATVGASSGTYIVLGLVVLAAFAFMGRR